VNVSRNHQRKKMKMSNTVTTVTSQANPLAYAKAIATLVGTIATALLGVYTADTEVGKVLTIVSIIATAIATWAIPNAPVIKPGDPLLVNSIGAGEEGTILYVDAEEGPEPYDPGAPLHGYEDGAGDPHRA
jgi:CBS-domain-containing membrane protein